MNTPSTDSRRIAQIVGLVLIGLLVMCGLAGMCLFVLSFFLQ